MTPNRQTDRETAKQAVAQRAYAIWEAEGRPDGREVDHWLRAEAEVSTAAVELAPKRQPRRVAATRRPRERKA